MLDESTVLDYVKTQLVVPYMPLEINDEQIISIVRTTTLITFSRYVPDINEVTVNPSDPTYQTEHSNIYRILDPDGLPIIDVVAIYMDMNGQYIAGHPLYGLLSGDYHSVIEYIEQTNQANTVFMFSQYRVTIEYIKPNLLRVTPNERYKFLVKYEREHKSDFSTIPNEFKMHFLKLAYADVARYIAKIRSQFREVNTPFGTIELNPDSLIEEANQIYDQVLEEIKLFNPPIIVDRG